MSGFSNFHFQHTSINRAIFFATVHIHPPCWSHHLVTWTLIDMCKTWTSCRMQSTQVRWHAPTVWEWCQTVSVCLGNRGKFVSWIGNQINIFIWRNMNNLRSHSVHGTYCARVTDNNIVCYQILIRPYWTRFSLGGHDGSFLNNKEVWSN